MDIDWYFDFVSPFSWLQLPKVRALAQRMPVRPVPVLVGALFANNGQLGPAEIPGKRAFTYRFAQWQAERDGVPLRFPPAHPFHPVAALRLCIAAGTTWDAVEAIFAHIWQHGRAADAESLAEVGGALGIADIASAIVADEVKAALRANTDAAIAAGVYGVPTLAADGELFWGNDATPMFEDWLPPPARFARGEYARLATLPVGVERIR